MNRLVDIRDSLQNGFDYERYRYTPQYVYRDSRYLYSDKPPQVRLDSIPLNQQGLAKYEFLGGGLWIYNTAGYLIQKTDRPKIFNGYKIENNNLIEAKNYFSDYTSIHHYTYYSNRLNLPNLKPFYGTQSQNLPASETTILENSIIYDDGPQYRVDYYYLFDTAGRVKRRVGYGTRLNERWPFGYGLRNLSVSNYEYECP